MGKLGERAPAWDFTAGFHRAPLFPRIPGLKRLQLRPWMEMISSTLCRGALTKYHHQSLSLRGTIQTLSAAAAVSCVKLFVVFFATQVGMVHRFGPDQNISKAIGWFAIKCYADIGGSQRMYPTVLGDPIICPLAPSWGLFWAEYLDNCFVDCHEIWCRHSGSPQIELE